MGEARGRRALADHDQTGRTAGRNRLLAAAPRAVHERLAQHLEVVRVARGQTLGQPGDVLHHTYFPVDGLLSCLVVTADRRTLELRSVASDGAVGLPTMLQPDRTPYLVTAQVAAVAVKIEVGVLCDAIRDDAPLRESLVGHAERSREEVALSAACHHFHGTLQRLCRWLLGASDRLHTDNLPLTHGQLANILGVQRTGITAAALELQDAGAVWYRRGVIRITHRRRLELSACRCYSSMRERLQPSAATPRGLVNPTRRSPSVAA